MRNKRLLDQAKEQIQKRHFEAALRLLDEILQNQPQHTGAREERAIVLTHLKRYDLALEDLSKILQSKEIKDVRLRRGAISLLVGDIQSAKKDFQRVLVTDPTDQTAIKGMGDAFYAEKNFKDATETYQQLLNDDPSQSDFIWYSLAETYYKAQDHEKALEAIDKAISIRAAPEYFAFKGDFYIRHDYFERALEQYILAGKMDPDDPEIQIRLGYIYRILKRKKEALSVLNRALRLDPRNIEAIKNKIELLEEMDKQEEMERLEQRLIRLQPENAAVALELAENDLKEGRFKQAGELFDGIIQYHPDNVGAWYGRARVLARFEFFDQALNAIEEVIAKADNLEPMYLELRNSLMEELE